MNIPAEVGMSPTLNMRGMIAARDIPKGELIEDCPLVLFSPEEWNSVENTPIGKYFFQWTNDGYCALALGYGSLYNHSSTANVEYWPTSKRSMGFFAAKNIQKGEELTINYHGDINNPAPISWWLK